MIVPALTFSPAGATGISPMPPATLTVVALLPPLLLEPLLLQAARAVMPATARATPATFVLRNFIIGPPSSRC